MTGGNPPALAGSAAWSGRVIFARDLEPVVTRLEASSDGPRLHIESESFNAILPASAFILERLACKLKTTLNA
jgi:hypothetical protein